MIGKLELQEEFDPHKSLEFDSMISCGEATLYLENSYDRQHVYFGLTRNQIEKLRDHCNMLLAQHPSLDYN